MSSYKRPKSVEIVYFSGTGGTKRAADLLSATFHEQGTAARCHELHARNPYHYEATDMLIVLYPVYALNAPKPIYDFISKLPEGNGRLTAVISVSGGGEVIPNTACRLHTIRRLKQKGYRIPYERMLVMPANLFMETPDELSLLLLEALPERVKQIVIDILSGRVRRRKPYPIDRVLSSFAEAEKYGSRMFGKRMKVSSDCSGCGLCEQSCPMGNIRRKELLPEFGDNCVICLRCVYNCPKKAITPFCSKIVMLPKGYQLEKLEHRMEEQKGKNVLALINLEEYPVSYGMSGVKKYLMEKD